MNENEEILIVKNPEEEVFYGLFKDDSDGIDEYTIISQGKTEVEALKNAFTKVMITLKNNQKKLKEIGSSISEDEIYLNEKFKVESLYIKKPTTFANGYTAESFDAMIFREGEWGRFYR